MLWFFFDLVGIRIRGQIVRPRDTHKGVFLLSYRSRIHWHYCGFSPFWRCIWRHWSIRSWLERRCILFGFFLLRDLRARWASTMWRPSMKTRWPLWTSWKQRRKRFFRNSKPQRPKPNYMMQSPQDFDEDWGHFRFMAKGSDGREYELVPNGAKSISIYLFCFISIYYYYYYFECLHPPNSGYLFRVVSGWICKITASGWRPSFNFAWENSMCNAPPYGVLRFLLALYEPVWCVTS